MYEKRGNKKTCILHFRVYPKDKAENAKWGPTEGRGQNRRDPVKCNFIVLTFGTMLMFHKL